MSVVRRALLVHARGRMEGRNRLALCCSPMPLERLLVCFNCSGEMMEMPADKVDVLLLQTAGQQLNNALTNPFFGVL